MRLVLNSTSIPVLSWTSLILLRLIPKTDIQPFRLQLLIKQQPKREKWLKLCTQVTGLSQNLS